MAMEGQDRLRRQEVPLVEALQAGGGDLEASLRRLEQQALSSRSALAIQLGDMSARQWVATDGEGPLGGGLEDARVVGFFIYFNVCRRDTSRTYFGREDLQAFYTGAAEAQEALNLLDRDKEGRVTVANVVDAVAAVYLERHKLVLTLQDQRSVVGKLELICAVVIHTMFALVYLSIFSVSVRALWLSVSSAVLAFAFVFGNSLRSLFECVIFLFVIHPYDVGDALQLSNGDVATVDEIALLSTAVVRVADGRRVLLPNARLLAEPCVNLSRSQPLFDSVTIMLDLGVQPQLLEALEVAVKAFARDHPKEFTGAAAVFIKGVEPTIHKLSVVVRFEFTHTGEDVPHTNRWRSNMLTVVAAVLHAAGAIFTLPPQVMYSMEGPPVAVMPGQANHTAAPSATRLLGRAYA